MAGSLRIAISQPLATADARRNGESARRLMRQAADAGARLLLLPEGHLSGYAKEQVDSWDDVEWPVVREEAESISALAGELALWTVIGSGHSLTPPHMPHNSMYVISDQGRLVDRYDKRICSVTEATRFYTPGFRPTVFEVDGYRFGVATCIEVNFPHLFEEYARLGVDCVLLPTYPVDSIFVAKARAQAAIFNLWIAVSSVEQARHLFDSQVFAPNGEAISSTAPDAPIAVAELRRTDADLRIALDLARPWRLAISTAPLTVTDDQRSRNLTAF